MRGKPRRQKRIEGGRKQVSSAFAKKIEAAVAAEMKRFNASRSFVIATAVAHALDVNEFEDYKELVALKGKRR